MFVGDFSLSPLLSFLSFPPLLAIADVPNGSSEHSCQRSGCVHVGGHTCRVSGTVYSNGISLGSPLDHMTLIDLPF